MLIYIQLVVADLIEYDLKSYYGELYGILFDAAFHYMLEDRPSPEMSSESEMILRGLELMFLKKRGVSDIIIYVMSCLG